MGIPKPKARRAEISQNDPPKQLKKLKPRKDRAQDVANVKPKGQFADQHVRWTGYLTVEGIDGFASALHSKTKYQERCFYTVQGDNPL